MRSLGEEMAEDDALEMSSQMQWLVHQTWRSHTRHQLSLTPLHLTPEEVKPFRRLAQAHWSPQARARRAQIVLTAHAHPTWSSQQIAKWCEQVAAESCACAHWKG